jgi:hypothetical protein
MFPENCLYLLIGIVIGALSVSFTSTAIVCWIIKHAPECPEEQW